jgi:RHS repeat-associated protein
LTSPEGVHTPTQRFTGKERDAETGLDYFGARYFSGAQGRFTTPDTPLVYAKPDNPQSWNLYSYGRNNPLRYVDPDGHDDVAAVGCGEDAECLKKLAEQRGKGVELISGAAKSVVNSFITLSNAVNTVVDSAIAPFTDFRFGQTELLSTTTTEQVGGVLADVGILALTAGGSAPTAAKSTISLFRAVGPAELAQIEKTGTFMNIAGNEVKYFSTTLEGAQSYAKQAARAFGDGPYTIVGSGIPTSAVRPDMLVTVDRGIQTVVVPTKVLPQLVKPRVIR